MFTAFVRRLIIREIEVGHPLFQAGELLQEADIQWLIQPCVSDKITCELPERGILIPKLGEMAFRMQLQRKTTESGQVKINFDQALTLLNNPLGDKIISAGTAMDILEKEPGSKHDQVFYLHQLIQEYFAARWFTEAPQIFKVQSLKNKLGKLLGGTIVELPNP